MTRVDLFTTIHKGLRAALFSAAEHVDRADFGSPAAAAAVAGGIGRLSALLDDQARHEEREVVPHLARIAPELAGDLLSCRSRLRGLEQELVRTAARLAGADEAGRLSLGRRLHDRFGPFIADHLRLMERIEVAVQRMLWANRKDDELAAIERRFFERLPPARIAAWLDALVPAVSDAEREALAAALRARERPADRAEALPC